MKCSSKINRILTKCLKLLYFIACVRQSFLIMNKYIDYIKKMKQDENVDKETYIDLIKIFKSKLEIWLMEQPRFSDDPDFIEMTTAIKYISDEVSLNFA